MADLHSEIADLYTSITIYISDGEDDASMVPDNIVATIRHHRARASDERMKAKRVLEKAMVIGIDFPEDIVAFLKEEDVEASEHDTD